MNEAVMRQARNYLAEPSNSLWNWTPNGDGVQWTNGQTIAFIDEIRDILRHQSARGTRGLPPFGALLLLVAATRTNWNVEGNVEWRRCRFENLISLKSQSLFLEVVAALDGIHTLEPEHRATLSAKQTLADIVFESSPRTTPEVGHQILRLLNSGIEEFFADPRDLKVLEASQVLIEDLMTLIQGLVHVEAERLTLLRETGVESLPTAESIELPDDSAPTSSDLFSELESDSELYMLGRAARQLYSVLSLPQPSFIESELQQGGVSDIANRGPLDRLLLSELAHDDLTLAVRVAVNEAMYLRRESPPQNRQRQQIIVLDCGLRSWGLPRLIGTAMGLALVARADDSIEPTVFCAHKGQLESISLSSREEIAEHLKTLRPELDLTDSLPGIEAMLSESETECDLVLVTNNATAESSSLSTAINQSKLLSNAKLSRLFVGSVAHRGDTKLIEINHLGRKPIKQLVFDVDRLKEHAPSRKRTATDVGDLPAFFGLEEMPLLLSYSHLKEDYVWPIGSDRMILLVGDGRMLYYGNDKFGGKQLSENIPAAKVCWSSSRSEDGVWSAVIGNDQIGEFQLVSFDEGSETIHIVELDISDRPVKGFCSHQGTLFAIYYNQVAIIDRKSGTAGEALGIPGNSWLSGRFFAHAKECFALSTDGFAPVLEQIALPWKAQEITTSMLHVMECHDVEGPIVVCTIYGEIFFVATDKKVAFKTDRTMKSLYGLAVTSADPISGSLCLKTDKPYRYLIVDVKSGNVKDQHYPTNFIQGRLNKLKHRQHQLRRRFPTITVLSDGTLRLASKNQHRLQFEVLNKELLLKEAPVRQGKLRKQPFQRTQRPDAMRYELQVARWEDGSEAWLDGRGLLHLRSSDLHIPELTITLSHGPIAGWCSDGEMFGSSFHIGETEPNKPLEDVLQIMKRFGEHILKSC